ncbi:MAG: hypothetical protein C0613_07135 [Desulfobulbaceae bacterium]|nr:MAG: hypothetical protein C0613_07135 [Desulfobulbaceae bacterium]
MELTGAIQRKKVSKSKNLFIIKWKAIAFKAGIGQAGKVENKKRIGLLGLFRHVLLFGLATHL